VKRHRDPERTRTRNTNTRWSESSPIRIGEGVNDD
jgi:hypothetical protein